MQKQQLKRVHHPEYATTFDREILNLALQAQPFTRTNVARADNIMNRGLADVMRRWRGELKYDGERPGFWFVKFPDQSEYSPNPDVIRRLRKIGVH